MGFDHKQKYLVSIKQSSCEQQQMKIEPNPLQKGGTLKVYSLTSSQFF